MFISTLKVGMIYFAHNLLPFLAGTPDKILREREKDLKTVGIKTNKQGTN